MSIVGSVTVRVVPSFTGNHRQIAQHFTGAGGVAGQVFSASMGKSIMSSTAKGLVYNRAGADIANRVTGSIRSSIVSTDFGQSFSYAFGKSRAIAAGEGGLAGQSWTARAASSISKNSAGVQSSITQPFTGALSDVVSVGNATGLSFVNAEVSSLSRETNGVRYAVAQPFDGALSDVVSIGNATGLNFAGATSSTLGASGSSVTEAATRPFSGVMSDVVSIGNATGLGFTGAAVSSLASQTNGIQYAVTSPFEGVMGTVSSIGNATGLNFAGAASSSIAQGGATAGQSFMSRLGESIGANSGAAVAAAGAVAQSIGDALQGIGGSISSVSQQLGALSEGLTSVGGSLTKWVTLPAVGAATAVAGIPAAFGWGRLVAMDTAQAQLRGLGYEAQDVERITDQLVTDLEGGMMTMAEATSAAAGAMATGVKEGAELTKYIQMLDAAVVGGTGTFYEMNNIFARTADLGYLNANNFDMMAQRMPGFSSAMQEHTGKSGDAFRDMLNDGEISLAEFLDVMDDFGGDMALEYARSWAGMWANTKNYIGIIGESILTGVFQRSKEEIGEFIHFLSSEDMAAWAENFGTKINEVFGQVVDTVRRAIDWWNNLDDSQQKLALSFAGIAVAAGPVLLVFGKIAGALSAVGKFLGPVVTWLGTVMKSFGGAASSGTLLSGAMGSLSRVLGVLTGPIGWIATGLIAVWSASENFRESVINLGSALWDSLVDAFQMVWGHVQNLGGSLKGLWGSLSQGGGLLDMVGTALSWLVDLLAWLLPILIEVAGFIISSVVVALDYLVQAITSVVEWMTTLGDESTTQGAIFAAVWGGIKDAVGSVVDWLMTHVVGNFKELWGIIFRGDFEGTGSFEEDSPVIDFLFRIREAGEALVGWFVNTALPFMQSVWQGIASGAIWLWENVLQPTWRFIQAAFNGLVAAISWAWESVLKPVFLFIGSVAMWLWGSVLQPVFGFIKAAFIALVSAFSWYWENILKQVFMLVGDIIRWLWNNVAKPLFHYIGEQWRRMVIIFQTVWNAILRPVINAVADIFRWLRDTAISVFRWIMERWEAMSNRIRSIYNNHIKPVIQAFGDFAKGLYNNYIRPALGWIMDRWDWLKGKISDIWNNGVKPILTAFGDFVRDTLVSRIKRGVNMIKDAWESVKEGFAKPINWVINSVWNNGIKKAFDGVAKAVGSNASLGKIDPIGGYAKGGKVKEDWYIAGEEGPELIHKGNASHRVYTADETAQAAQAALVGQKAKEGKDFTPAEQKQLGPNLLPWGNPLAKAWNWTVDNTPVGDALNWVRGGFADMAEGLLQPLLDLAGDNLKGNGLFGDLSHGLVQWGFDQVMEWIRGEDQEDMGDWGTYGSGEVDAYIRALREHESNNNYRAVNPSSGAAGAYQYITSTWGRHGGYARAHLAPKSVQDAKARADSLSAFNRLGSWEKVAANHLYPAWANSPGKWGQVPAPGNPTVQQYVNSIMSKMSKYATSAGGNPGGFNRPMQGPITSRAGRRNYMGAFGNMHYGVDIGGPIGSPVRAAYSGTVKGKSGGGLNRTLVLGHGGFDTAYMHNRTLIPAMGAKVTGGQLIARSGTAGSGPHLHFELHPGGYYNPSVAGVNALFRDKGGLVYPGMNLVQNDTGKAEYTFNQNQFDNLNRLAESGGRGGEVHFHQHGIEYQYADRNAQAFVFAERRESRKVGVR